MKNALFGFAAHAAAVLIALGAAAAQNSTPEKSLAAALSAMKAGGGVPALVDYVDWEFMFNGLPDSARRAMNVRSARELREYHLRFYSNPAAHVERHIHERRNIAPKEPPLSAQEKKELISLTVKQVASFNRSLAQAQYTVGQAVTNGPQADVPYEAEVNGIRTSARVGMRLNEGRWLLTQCPIPLETDSGPPGDSSQRPGVKVSE